MADHIEVTAHTNESFSEPALRGHLADVDGVSQSSPVSDGLPEAAVDHNQADGMVHVRVEGHEGDFTKTSQDEILKAVRATDGAVSPEVTAGGYEPEE